MKQSLVLLLLASLIWLLFCHSVLAAIAEQCSVGFFDDDKILANGDLNKQPVQQAKPATTHDPKKNAMCSSNNGEIKQRKMTLTADELQLTHRRLYQNKTPMCTITATGNVNYASNEIKLHGTKAWLNLNNKDIDVYHGYYYMVGRQGHGDAAAMKRRGNRYTVLENGSFTSCIKGDDSWSLVSSEFIHDKHWQVAKIWNARFKIGKLPVFYSPYLKIPVGEKRRSGLIIPHAKYGSHNGLEFSAPYYLNLAPNYDATITPKYLSKRGIQMQTEFRYLTIGGKGLFEFDWLPKERFYRIDNTSNERNRWLLHWHHNLVRDKVWRLNADYTKVSDYNYFADLDSKYGSTTDGYARQKFSLGYTKENLDAAISYKQFQLFDKKSSTAYSAAPQLDLTYYKNNLGPFNLKVFSQAAKFTNLNQYYPESYRLHIEPTLNLPITNSWWRLNTETKLMATHYYQHNIDYYNINISTGRHLKGVINRILPQFKTYGSLVFERNMNYAPKYMQTLEMRLQYLYVPYRNQNNIGVYDSTILQTDYSGMFRDCTYSGLDRISSANQLINSFTTIIYDAQYAERLNASVSQIYYFSPPSTGDITSTWNNIGSSGVWAGDSLWRISDQWVVRGNLQYESCLNRFTLGQALLEYRCNDNRILQLNYRYVSKQYLDKLCSGISHNGYTQGISQVGVIGLWPLVKRLSLVGAYYHDHNTNQPANQLISLQYNNCCWAINMNYERNITGWNTTNSASIYDNKVSFKIELRGLNSNSGLVKNQMLISGILPYQRNLAVLS